LKKLTLQSLVAITILATASTASAFWGGNNNRWGGNSYDEWDPRYWAEEMEDFFGSDNDNYGFGGNGPRGYAPYGGGYGYAPYGNAYAPAPYGYAPHSNTYAPAPYGYAPQAPAQQR